jgi:serine/threonine protein phosphatase PrpC
VKSFWQKIFGKVSPTKNEPERANVTTAPLTELELKAIQPKSVAFEPPQLIVGCGQSVGKQRDHNEDSIFAFTTNMVGGASNQAMGIYIVADGMGGHQYGEIASEVAVRSMASHLLRKFHPYLAHQSESLDEPVQDIMREAMSEAQRAVMKAAPGSGTTLTAALILGNHLTIAHVGDSRAYSIHQDGRVDILTRDHSLVKRLEELGQLAPGEAATHPQRNVLYRALGQGEILEPDVYTAPFPNAGYLVLCSDGLWGLVTEMEIFRAIVGAPTLHNACRDLIAAANAAGGPDNISLIIVQSVG